MIDLLSQLDFSGGIEGIAPFDAARRGALILATTPRPPVGLTPHEVVHQHDKLVVRYYAPASMPARTTVKRSEAECGASTPGPRSVHPEPARGHDGAGVGHHRKEASPSERATEDVQQPGSSGVERRTPVVLVPSLINKAYILDLEPERSLVRALSEAGHPTYLIDWGDPGPEDATEDVGYVLHDLLHRSIRRICRHAGSEQVHLFGYCMGGTLTAMYTALRPQHVATLSTLAAPVKFSEGGRFRDFVADGVLDLDRATSRDGLVPVDVMKPAFKLLDPMGNYTKLIAMDRAARKPSSLRRALARERWLEENVAMPGAFAREFIGHTYQSDALLAGTWEIRGERVDLSSIEVPTLVVACENDFISPAPAVEPLADVVSGPVTLETAPSGHIGVVVGRQGPAYFYPLLDRWFSTGTTEQEAP